MRDNDGMVLKQYENGPKIGWAQSGDKRFFPLIFKVSPKFNALNLHEGHHIWILGMND